MKKPANHGRMPLKYNLEFEEIVRIVSMPSEKIIEEIRKILKEGKDSGVSNMPFLFYRVKARDNGQSYDFYVPESMTKKLGKYLGREGFSRCVREAYQTAFYPASNKIEEARICITALEVICGIMQSLRARHRKRG